MFVSASCGSRTAKRRLRSPHSKTSSPGHDARIDGVDRVIDPPHCEDRPLPLRGSTVSIASSTALIARIDHCHCEDRRCRSRHRPPSSRGSTSSIASSTSLIARIDPPHRGDRRRASRERAGWTRSRLWLRTASRGDDRDTEQRERSDADPDPWKIELKRRNDQGDDQNDPADQR